MKVYSNTLIEPLEWDITSSNITVYHRTNITQITTNNNQKEWEYDEEQITFEDFANTLYGKQLKKIESFNGSCSGAIYKGVAIGTFCYNFTENTQMNLAEIADLLRDGQTLVLYRADNETSQRLYTADEMKVIIKAKAEWKTINTNYYELLKQWVNRETDETILNAIHYGSTLPTDLMTELTIRLSGVGIDLTKYAVMLKQVIN